MASSSSATGGPAGDDAADPDHPPSRWKLAFEAVLPRILADYASEDTNVRDGMASGMRKLFEHPYEAELGSLGVAGSTAPLSLEDAQRVIFFPRFSDMRYYARAFCLKTPDERARRHKIMKFKLMSVFYTLHRKDGELMERFMHLGGLEGLVALLGEDNNVIQSEAVELLLEFLSPLMTLQPPNSKRRAHLHHQVFLCLRSATFWQNFAAVVAEPAEVFPNSHINCVKIMAGALGWLRPDEEGGIAEAGPPPDLGKPLHALQQFLDSGPPVPPDIRNLAEELMPELAGALTIRADPLKGRALEEVEEELHAPALMAQEDASHAWQVLRQLGNEAFGNRLFLPAEAAYARALEEGAGALPSSEASTIESNRSLVLLRAGRPDEAAAAASRALQSDPRNAKAAYRRAQALLDQHGEAPLEGSTAAAQEALWAANLAAELQPKDPKVAELLQRATKRMEDVQAFAGQPGAPPQAEDPLGLAGGLESMD